MTEQPNEEIKVEDVLRDMHRKEVDNLDDQGINARRFVLRSFELAYRHK